MQKLGHFEKNENATVVFLNLEKNDRTACPHTLFWHKKNVDLGVYHILH
jgi:hypothetical protein